MAAGSAPARALLLLVRRMPAEVPLLASQMATRVLALAQASVGMTLAVDTPSELQRVLVQAIQMTDRTANLATDSA